MSIGLEGKKVAVLGGDDRELVLIPELVRFGAEVRVAGFGSHQVAAPAILCNTPENAADGVDVVIMPMPGTDAKGVIRAVYSSDNMLFDEKLAKKLKGVPVFIGVAKPYLKDLCCKQGVPLIEIAELDDIAIFNSIPTAEGAIQIAMEETPFTIHKSHCFVLGFGRCGETLARNLKSLGAYTYVAARKDSDLARIYELCLEPVPFNRLDATISRAQIIFNTVPAQVLDADRLRLLDRGCLVIDLATAPGGTDFRAAEKLGIKAILAPGLPGKVAPITAGKILAEVLPKLIVKHTT
jgi:dipicolinate synthase subunit A